MSRGTSGGMSPADQGDIRSNGRQRARWNLAAAFAGWFLPGLGHLLIGERNRGLILAVTIGSIWLSGLFIGGISVVDRREHGFFFVIGQMWVAPSFVVDAYHTRLRASWIMRQQAGDAGPPLYEPALGKPEEIGSLYVTVAGLLNLLSILDVLYREPR